MTEIETPRLRLRHWIVDDFEALVAMCADARVMEFFPAPLSREETEAMWRRIHEHFASYGFGPWAVEVDGQFAGSLGLNWITRFETHFTPREDGESSGTHVAAKSGAPAIPSDR
jgi:RimJ/RimL family protein N-acetyltransferase